MPQESKLSLPVSLVWLGSLVVSVSDPMTARSWVQSLTTALSSNNLGQVVHTPQPVGAMPQFGGPADQNIQIQIHKVSVAGEVTCIWCAAGSSKQNHWHGACPVEEGYYRCADGSGCVSPVEQCDGRAQCSDGDDETDRCRDSCSADCTPGVCQHTPLGARCRPCDFGLRLNPLDNRTCVGTWSTPCPLTE